MGAQARDPQGHCAAVGRDEATIRKTWCPEVFLRETEAEIEAAGSRSFWGEPVDSWKAGNLVGTPEQVADVSASWTGKFLKPLLAASSS